MNCLDKIKETTGLDRDVAISQGKYVLKAVRKFDITDEENHIIKLLINDDSVDRDGEVVRPSAFKDTLDYYLESGVVLFAHNYSQPPIAKMVKHELDDKQFIAYDQFAVEEYDFARTCWQLAKGGYLKAASVGFIPLEYEDPDEENKAPGQTGITYTKCELLEHSILPVGSNRNALIKIYNASKGKVDKAVMDMMQKLIEQPQKYKCDHPVLYDIEANVIELCPICAEIDKSEGQSENQIESIFIPIEVTKEEMLPMEKPYDNEHACRLKDPGQYKTCRSSTRKHNNKEYRVLYCQRKDDATKWEEQAYRYNKNIWTENAAKNHCKDKNGSFEPAKKGVEAGEDGLKEENEQKNVFVISGRTEESEKHDHAFRLYKDANGVISGNTIRDWSEREDEDHIHLIVKRESTEKYEEHTHDINVFKNTKVKEVECGVVDLTPKPGKFDTATPAEKRLSKSTEEYDTANFSEILDRLSQKMEVE